MFRQIAKRAMTTRGQKACIVIDHLVEALGNDPSSSIRRALILNDIDQHPTTTQTEIMTRLGIDKSSMNREIEWLFNYGCIMRQESEQDGRAKPLEVCGYSKRALDSALDYFMGNHENLKKFLEGVIKIAKQEKPTLRDARIIATLYEKGSATKGEVIENLYNGPSTTDNRAYKKLVDEGIIKE